jgi:hypothetical protein
LLDGDSRRNAAASIPTPEAARRRTVKEEGEPGNAHGDGNGDDLEGQE